MKNQHFSTSSVWGVENGIVALEILEFVQQFAAALKAGFDLLNRKSILKDPDQAWKDLIPIQVPGYGSDGSAGHCIRADIVLTSDGPRVCELDYVPSGRGFLSNALPEKYREAFLSVFKDWYRDMGVTSVLYATGSRLTYGEDAESELFCKGMRDYFGFDIQSGNIDKESANSGRLIDRLFYRSELSGDTDLKGLRVITAEPYLDSKMCLARLVSGAADARLGPKVCTILRRAIPETIPLSKLRIEGGEALERVARYGGEWVIKNSDVETDSCWGSRGVMLGENYSHQAFRAALLGEKVPHQKVLGSQPVLQRFCRSVDFGPIWNLVASKEVVTIGGTDSAQITTQPATAQVHARVGVFFLVSYTGGVRTVSVPPYGILTLRQNVLVHGARDASFCPFFLV